MKGDLLQVKNNDEISDYDGTSLLNLSSFVYNEDTTSINIQKKEGNTYIYKIYAINVQEMTTNYATNMQNISPDLLTTH